MIVDVGDLAHIRQRFTDGIGAPDDPAGVAFWYRKPGGQTGQLIYPSASLVKEVVGTYRADIRIDQAGRWRYEWQTTDDIVGGDLYAVETPSDGDDPEAGLLARTDDLRGYLNDTDGRVDRELAGRLLAQATSRVQRYLPDRLFLPDPPLNTDPPVVRTVIGAPLPAVVGIPVVTWPAPLAYATPYTARIPDLRYVTEVTADSAVLDATAYRLRGRDGQPATRIELGYRPASLTIAGYWGWTDPPADIRHATVVMAARAYHDRTARYADTVQDPDGGVSSYFRQFPPDVKQILDSYRTPGL